MRDQWNMSPAKPADPQILSSTRERTDCTLSLATRVVLDAVLQLSRLVSLHRLAKDADSRAKDMVVWLHWGPGVSELSLEGNGCILSSGLCSCLLILVLQKRRT